jgi:RimJ/RimL family protein N-acetyltransferase
VEHPDVFPLAITGRRVRLREVGADDAAAAMAWAADPEFFRYMAYAPVADQAAEEEFLRGIQDQARARPRVQYHVGVVWLATDELIGMVRLGITSAEHREGDLGYGLRLDRAGQGITTEAAGLLLRFGFETLRLHRVFAYHHPDNRASERVMEKLGMQREGTLRENLFEHGAWRDSVVHSVLEHEWRATRPDQPPTEL